MYIIIHSSINFPFLFLHSNSLISTVLICITEISLKISLKNIMEINLNFENSNDITTPLEIVNN